MYFYLLNFSTQKGKEESELWEAIVKAYKNHEKVIGILNYTYFDSERRYRYQPDILLVTDNF